jgi:hypothetical protein
MTAICPRCGLTAECDDREDALGWLRAHWDERHDPERIIRARVRDAPTRRRVSRGTDGVQRYLWEATP